MTDLKEIIDKLEKAFKSDEIKKKVLDNEWYERNISSNIDCTGFCYTASAVIYNKNGRNSIWTKKTIGKAKWDLGGHCYLVNKETGSILDITSDQYTSNNINIPYKELGCSSGGFSKKILVKANILSKLAGLGEL